MAEYKGVAYDPQMDYMAAIQKATDPILKQQLETQRAAKIYGQGFNQYASTIPQNVQNVFTEAAKAAEAVSKQKTFPGTNVPMSNPANYEQRTVVSPPDTQKYQALGVPPAISNPAPQQQAQQMPKYNPMFMNNIQGLLGQLGQRMATPAQYDPTKDVGLQSAQNQAMNEVAKQAARRNMLYSDGSRSQMNQAALNLVPQYQQLYNQQQQQELNNLFKMLDAYQQVENANFDQFTGLANLGLDTTRLGEQIRQYDQSRKDSSNLQQGLVQDPTTGKLVQTAQQKEAERQRIIDGINAMGDSTDFQSKINAIKSDNDPTNDWQADYFNARRDKKIQDQLSRDVQTIGQFSGDYQAEINRRAEINPNDPLIPYLKIARLKKIEDNQASALSAAEKQIKMALDLFKVTKVINSQEMSDILGLPIGTTTGDYAEIQSRITENLAQAGAAGASAGVAANRLAFDIAKYNDPNNPENILKQKQIEKLSNGGMTQKDVLDAAKDMEDADAREFIINSGLSDAEIVRTLNMLNIPQE